MTILEQCRVWRERIPQLHMSIIMSYIQLRQRGIANRILDIVGRSGVPGSAITLEVTESMQIQDLQRFNRIFCKLLNLHDEDILKTTNLGLWVIRLSKDGTHGEMYVDQTMRKVLGIRGELTAEECCRHWYDRSSEGYFHYVNFSVRHMIETGETTVRCLGTRVADLGDMNTRIVILDPAMYRSKELGRNICCYYEEP